MATKTYTVQYRRKREGKTNYKKRLRLLLSGTPRLVIRRSLRNITAQVIQFSQKGDVVLVTATSKELPSLGWGYGTSNCPAAYLTGLLLAKKAKEKKITELIVDAGLYPSTPQSRIYAVVKGCVEGGIQVPCDKEVLPSDDRVLGRHIAGYGQSLQTKKDLYQKQFSSYLANNKNPTDMPSAVSSLKTVISGKK